MTQYNKLIIKVKKVIMLFNVILICTLSFAFIESPKIILPFIISFVNEYLDFIFDLYYDIVVY